MKRLSPFIGLLLTCCTFFNNASAEVFYEVTAGASKLALDIEQRLGTQTEDDSTALNFSIAAYRNSTETSYWGAVIEVSSAISRDDDLPGSGRIIGFRFADYLKKVGEHSAFEVYAGFAQFDFIEKANGYYFGANYRYDVFSKGSGLLLETKYYQDLSYDSPQGDDIVDGFQTSLKYYYQF